MKIPIELQTEVNLSVPEDGLDFKTLEQWCMQLVCVVFVEVLEQVLRALDEQLKETRDRARYQINDFRERTVETLVGPVRIYRRYYEDVVTGERVFLLDRLLGLPKRVRLSSWLQTEVVQRAVRAPSYRKAAAGVSSILRAVSISHEGARQQVLKAGTVVQQQERELAFAEVPPPAELRSLPVLFIEADGIHCHQQGQQQSTRELQVGAVHEGWVPRYGEGSDEWALKHKRLWVTDEGWAAFWEGFSRIIHQYYDLSQTIVVINGDGDPGIRAGRDGFTDAKAVFFQYDPLHVNRRLKRILAGRSGCQQTAIQAYQDGDWETLEHVLKAHRVDLKRKLARSRGQPQQRRHLRQKLRDLKGLLGLLLEQPEIFQDYRQRLRMRGVDTTALRGMGNAESQVAVFADRLKLGRYAWSTGLKAMAKCLKADQLGTLEAVTAAAGDPEPLVPWDAAEFGSGRLTTDVTRAAVGAVNGHLAALDGPEQGKNFATFLRRFAAVHPVA